jgi:hypothetical protein
MGSMRGSVSLSHSPVSDKTDKHASIQPNEKTDKHASIQPETPASPNPTTKKDHNSKFFI